MAPTRRDARDVCQVRIKGFTTNPTLMRKAGITDYQAFARDILREIPDRSISFEVFADDFEEMERQAREIATWGPHVYVKIPITNTQREPCYARCTADPGRHQGQRHRADHLGTGEGHRRCPRSRRAVLRVGICRPYRGYRPRPRPADVGVGTILRKVPATELIWASPRELLNIFQADSIGCHVITVTNDILKKLSLVGYGLDEYSLETVKMFHEDAQKAAYTL